LWISSRCTDHINLDIRTAVYTTPVIIIFEKFYYIKFKNFCISVPNFYNFENKYEVYIYSQEYPYIWCVSESGDFLNVMNSKCFQLFSFNTYEHNVYIKAFRFFTFNTLKTKVLLPENYFIQMTTIPL